MIKEEGTLEKLLTIEKAVNEMTNLRQGILELKASETERQKALEALRTRENRYRSILENLPQKIFMKDNNSAYVLCNQNYAADLKIKAEEIFGRSDYEFFPRELAEKYALDEKRIISTGRSETIKENYVHEGQTFRVHMIRTPVRDERGDIIGILGIFWDITEQEREEEKNRIQLEEFTSQRAAELQMVKEQLQQEITEGQHMKDQLTEAEERYRTLWENTGTAVAVIGEDMIISSANREFEKLSGYSRAEVEGKRSLREFIIPDDREEIGMAYFTGNADTVPRCHEARFMGQQGNIRDIRVTVAMLPGVKKGVVSLMDVTDYKRTEESLRDLQERHEALIENPNEAILVIQEGLLKSFNKKILEITGYPEDELTSKPFKEFIYPDDQNIFQLHLRKIEHRELSDAQCFKLIHRDGHILFWEARGTLIQWEGKAAVLNFMMDLTDRKRAEEELWNSIKPFRSLVNAVEKNFLTWNEKWPERGGN